MGFFSRPQSPWLSRRFGPAISVLVLPDRVEFRTEAKALSLAPVLFVRDGLIVSVGEQPAGPSERLDVFAADGKDRAQSLARLLQYGLHAILEKKLGLKPVVTVSSQAPGISFDELRPALLAAGAAEVRPRRD
jgi:hypothetical protein